MRLFGIHKKLMVLIMLLILSVLSLAAVGVNAIVAQNKKADLIRQYTYVNDKLYQVFQSLYSELNTAAESCITNEYVQKSLKNKKLDPYEGEIISRTLGFLGNNYVEYSVFIDNKENIYSPNKIEIDFTTFYNCRIYKDLGEEYSRLKLFWHRDFLSGSMDMALFAGRYVRQLDRYYKPGVIYMKVDNRIMEPLFQEARDQAPAFYILDNLGQICFRSYDLSYGWREEQKLLIEQNMPKAEFLKTPAVTKAGIYFGKEHKETGFTVVTFVPAQFIHQVVFQIIFAILIIFVLAALASFLLSRYFSRRFTQPIRYISNLMESFDDSNLTQQAVLATNTELDDIGRSYNRMLVRISQLLSQVRYKERELRKAELDTLLYQIQPHFLYNTLDTIYMLARISREKTIMSMIMSLSTFLRINLSNGAEKIPILSELENVKAYMEIQKIRKDGLFDYTIDCDASIGGVFVLKMLLQPLVENSIKHGFREIEQKGEIAITVRQMGEDIVFSVENNGLVMEEKAKERLNRLESVELDSIGKIITHKQGGYGISNVVKRLRLCYEDGLRFYYVTAAKKTVCIIKIKKEMMEKAQ